MIYAQPRHIASMMPRLCLTAPLSLLQARFGILMFTLSPETAHRSVNICGRIIMTAAVRSSGLREIQKHMLHISAGTAVKSIWSFSFALRICHEVTGSERAIQRLLPSRDIAGAVSIFIEESRHKSKHAKVGAYSSKSSSIRVTTPINQSLFISEKTATAIINSAPSEQLSI